MEKLRDPDGVMGLSYCSDGGIWRGDGLRLETI